MVTSKRRAALVPLRRLIGQYELYSDARRHINPIGVALMNAWAIVLVHVTLLQDRVEQHPRAIPICNAEIEAERPIMLSPDRLRTWLHMVKIGLRQTPK